MAAETQYNQYKSVNGQIKIARASVNNTTGDVIASVSGKRIFVLGLEVTAAAAQTLTLSSASDTLGAYLNTTNKSFPLTPGPGPHDFAVHHQTASGEAFKATTTQNTNFIAYYVTE